MDKRLMVHTAAGRQKPLQTDGKRSEDALMSTIDWYEMLLSDRDEDAKDTSSLRRPGGWSFVTHYPIIVEDASPTCDRDIACHLIIGPWGEWGNHNDGAWRSIVGAVAAQPLQTKTLCVVPLIKVVCKVPGVGPISRRDCRIKLALANLAIPYCVDVFGDSSVTPTQRSVP